MYRVIVYFISIYYNFSNGTNSGTSIIDSNDFCLSRHGQENETFVFSQRIFIPVLLFVNSFLFYVLSFCTVLLPLLKIEIHANYNHRDRDIYLELETGKEKHSHNIPYTFIEKDSSTFQNIFILEKCHAQLYIFFNSALSSCMEKKYYFFS